MKLRLQKLSVIVGLSGACALGWWIFHPRPLNIGLRVENATAKNPFMEDPLATRMSVLPAPEMPPSNEIISSQCAWTLQSVQYRPNSNALWSDVTPDAQQKNPPVRLYSQNGRVGYSDTFFPLYREAGEWKSLVRADVNIQTLLGRWHGHVEHEIRDVVSAADLQHRISLREATERKDKQRSDAQPSVPRGAIPLVAGKRYIGKIQWSEDAGKSWHDVPAAGKGAVAVPPFTSLGLRAVKATPKTEWPDYPDFLPYWNYAGQKSMGDTVFVSTPEVVSRSDSDWRTATVYCGQKVNVKIRVLPPGKLVVYAASEPKSNAKNSEIMRVYARSDARQLPSGAKIRFTATYTNGSRADLINKPGAKDDSVAVNFNRAVASLRKSARPGSVVITAQILIKKGKILAKSDVNVLVNFVAPTH